ncbi:type II secretion system protein [Adhaeretor mobilis]|uniref:Type II secretion system protein n=1 Tax=Adhaeretor mobilis TaxID=1930276 RepID=A0A517MU03_9BACT|nr:type II secretion system protein [Adhaeretor mobilis]QDS98342.1 hypothetical protein HG15A2_16150 [Adhaeretor mobilis]
MGLRSLLVASARHPQRRAFTMVETVICSLLVGVVITGALASLGASVRTQVEMTSLIDGPLLVDQLLAEIMALPYNDPENNGNSLGTNAGENETDRTTFDDVDDYDGWSASPAQNHDGTAMVTYSGWSRSVDVAWAARTNGGVWGFYDTGLKRIRVTVTAPDGTSTERLAYRSEDGSLEQKPAVDRTAVTQLQGKLQIGSGSAAQWTTNLLNHAEDPNAS